MALVSISEAARLTGKSRTTVQSYIKQGKLTRCTDSNGASKIDTSELLRVFGSFTGQQVGSEQSGSAVQHLAGNTVQVSDQILQHENQSLKAEVELVKALLREKEILLAEKDKRNEDLKHALLLIESKLPATPEPVAQPATKKSWQFWKK
ncbi:DNA-binding protein [Xenorhabdus bovienii]|uniref:helix-turn-helix domain-containing protein n=1 Tax=Xenorhabdus bovienii TaxID=40576 RepID=UPI0023B2DBE6|nr:helix-turn-helix domain-containing protein [Xenorhabdus bovienii]MDE9519441.1 DNA-binding protein [Xenorhabdus bovienii]